MRRSVGLGAISALFALALAGCGNGKVIGSGPVATPTPGTPHVSFEYKVTTANSSPEAITTGADGFLYFTEKAGNQIGQLSTGGVLKEYPTAANASPTDIIRGADNNIWVTEPGISSIGTFVAATGKITDYSLGSGSAPQFIANGPGQGTMYFTDSNGTIGQIKTDGTHTSFAIPSGASSNPMGIALGADQNMWFCENGTSKIGVLNTAALSVSEIALPAGANPVSIIQGPDKAMWFTENYATGPKLGHLTTNGQFTEYALAGAKSVAGLYLALDGNIYVADPGNNAIGRFEINSLSYQEYPVKTSNATPLYFTTGPDSRLYFTEQTANQIGQFSFF